MTYINNKDTDRDYTGFDQAISKLQTDLKSRFPFAKIYHRAYLLREKDVKGKVIKIPKVWEDGKEYINVLPNDFNEAMAFFYPVSDEYIKEFDREQSINNLYERDVCVIMWLNTEKLEEHETGPSLSQIKGELLEVLSKSDIVVRVNNICDNDAEHIYREFTIRDEDTQYLMLPYAGLRIDFKIKYDYLTC